eukprot:5243923-Pleurochrysis_carterae.AAC.1
MTARNGGSELVTLTQIRYGCLDDCGGSLLMLMSCARRESQINKMRQSVASVGHIWNRPIRMTLPDTKSVMKYALSCTRAKQEYAR